MKKFFLIFTACVLCVHGFSAHGAVAVKKAAPVTSQSASASSGAASLANTVLGLVSNVQQINEQTRALTEECIPTTQEINFVNNVIKEWAKTGAMSADDVAMRLGRRRCALAIGGYENEVRTYAGDADRPYCYDYFAGDGNKGMVWENFPHASRATYCTDGSPLTSCKTKNQKTVSDIYEIFNLVDFGTEDYTTAETAMAGKLISKIESCSTAKLNAKKREIWGNFLVETAGSLGKQTSTGDIMQSVQGIVGGGGGFSSLGTFATQVLGK